MKLSFSDLPIRRKVMLAILLTSVVVMLLMRGAFFTYEYITFREAMVRQLSMLSQIVAANSTAALAFQNHDDATEILSALRAEQQLVAAVMYDADGQVFAYYPESLRTADLPSTPGAGGYQYEGSRLSGFQPVVHEGRRLGTLYLKFDTGTMLREWLWGSLTIAAAVMAVVLLVAYLLSQALQKQISEPIIALAQTARAVSERGDYSVRAGKVGRDEIGLLTGAFNQMLSQIQLLNRELEQRVLQRTAQLEAANKELEAFSYSVSHDLRAPLRHVDGFASMLLKADGHLVSERGRRYLDNITGSAKQMGVLIDDLLVFSRMGRSEMKYRDVDLAELADETIKTLREQNPGRNIRWKRGPLPVVQGDHPMLRQVFVNLLANAVKYSGPRDPAEIEIGCQEDTAAETVFFVRDNGVGFEMEYASKLFGVFQRLHRSEDFEGTGIGLANVRRIVNRHGGRTWAEGRPDHGATFYFSLPKHQPTQST